ncbi:hypothetical protein [Streptomyces pratensis]|uniref:hypothetical protein n=1 Tax=Streptomyces pratensis TaxID=1169025 RepID=UPI003019ABB3
MDGPGGWTWWRSSLAPPPLPADRFGGQRQRPCVVSGDSFDPFLPPPAPGPAVRRRLGAELRVVEDAGHLLLDEASAEAACAVKELCRYRETGS